jgi:DNA-binding winged helix-turn-helix (wHTH) protein/tetratricopeptide (TPR) repeat protein
MTSIPAPAGDVLRVRDVTLDLARQVVRVGQDEIRLRPKTFDVLTVLVRHAGRVVSKQRLMEDVWGEVAVTDDSLVQCLVEIRRALGEGRVAIRTVRGRGYLLDGGIAEVAPPAAEAGGGEAGPPGEAVTGPVGRRWLPWGIAAATVALVATLLAMVAAVGPFGSRGARTALQDTMVPDARRELDAGLGLLQVSRAQTDLQLIREHFERAVRLDPGYAAAHAALGNVLVLVSGFGMQPPLEVLPLAGRSARRALELDPTLAAGWQALAHVQTQGEWDWAGAEQSYRRAIALDPAAPMNMIFAHLLVGLGRTEAALAESDRLLAFDPASPMRLGSNCIVKYLARRFADAVAACERSLERDPDYTIAHFWRALALSGLDRHDEAMAAALASRRAMGFAPAWVVGYVHARAGRLADAREVLRALQARAETAHVPPVEVAFLCAAVGDRAQALDWLERAHRERGSWTELLAVYPAADPLRQEPRFRALLAALRLSEPS